MQAHLLGIALGEGIDLWLAVVCLAAAAFTCDEMG